MPPPTNAMSARGGRTAGRSYRKIVVKLGTGLLTLGGDGLSARTMEPLVAQIAQLHREGRQLVIVSSGAVAAGRHLLGVAATSSNVVERQTLAAVGQVELMRRYAELFGRCQPPVRVAQAMLTRRDILGHRLSYLNARNTLLALLEREVIPVVNENDVVAVEELVGEVFGDNDNLSAMVANLVDSDLLVLLGQVKGLYTTDPNIHPDEAELVHEVADLDLALQVTAGPSSDRHGRGGMITKLEAARVVTASGTDVVIASGLTDSVLLRLAAGAFGEGDGRICTLIPATGTRLESRKRWMVAGRCATGRIVVDDGAARALLRHNRSLLPAGVALVVGRFDRGDIVPILNPQREEIACGFSNYASTDLDRIKGTRSAEIERVLGHDYGEEVVHRNHMVVLPGH